MWRPRDTLLKLPGFFSHKSLKGYLETLFTHYIRSLSQSCCFIDLIRQNKALGDTDAIDLMRARNRICTTTTSLH